MTGLLLLAAVALDPNAGVWKTAPPTAVALHRTPPLYSTDPPAALEIAAVEVKLVREGGKTVARLEWRDASAEKTAGAPDGFADGVALMVPAKPVTGDLNPSLQMGDPAHPVLIYYYDAARGAALMEAAGRGTTRRTKEKFPAQAAYEGGKWVVTMELPELAPGAPYSLAVWNGRQQDRDGRKYFSIWQRTP
jgi:DMSO reductase family type II enzyme heme b subunit